MQDVPGLAPLLGLYRHRHTVKSMGALALSGRHAKGRTIASDFEQASHIAGRVPTVDRELLAGFMRTTKIDPAVFKHGSRIALPPTYYVTWCMAALADSLVQLKLPFDYSRVLHAGSEVSYMRPLFVDEVAHYDTRVVGIDDNERRARVRVETVVRERDGHGDEIFRNLMELHVPKAAPKDAKKGPRPSVQAPFVAPTMRSIGEYRLSSHAGRDYSLVSGDFNPVHWSHTAAKALGFRTLFLQGYCSKALIAHSLIKSVLRGASDKLVSVKVEFRKPVFLPAKVSVFASAAHEEGGLLTRSIALGRAIEGEAFVTGSVSYRL